jgi:hypothetical protein
MWMWKAVDVCRECLEPGVLYVVDFSESRVFLSFLAVANGGGASRGISWHPPPLGGWCTDENISDISKTFYIMHTHE